MEVKLLKIRLKQGISQEELAEKLEVSRQTISKWENGVVRPSAENLIRLSEVYGIPIDALLKDDWVPPETPEIQVVEVPVPRPRNYRLWALLAAVLVAAGIAVGAIFFRERPEAFVPESEIKSEVIDPSTIYRTVPLLPMD